MILRDLLSVYLPEVCFDMGWSTFIEVVVGVIIIIIMTRHILHPT